MRPILIGFGVQRTRKVLPIFVFLQSATASGYRLEREWGFNLFFCVSREQLAKRDINQFDQRARFDDDTQRPEPLLLWPRGTTRPDKCRDRSSSSKNALERNRLFSSGVEQFR